jgi:hypothetical protein
MKDSIYHVVNKKIDKSNFNNQIERYSDKYSKLKTISKSAWRTGLIHFTFFLFCF